jgi:hypothetical protein
MAVMPTDQMSDLTSLVSPSSISGAMKSGVPMIAL